MDLDQNSSCLIELHVRRFNKVNFNIFNLSWWLNSGMQVIKYTKFLLNISKIIPVRPTKTMEHWVWLLK